MISKKKYINQSLELNLFFLRIMKEHAIFLEAALPCKNKDLINTADNIKNEFTELLLNAISLAEGVIPPNVLASNEIVTKYTMDAETATQALTGIFIDSRLTSMENSLTPNANNKNIAMLTKDVYMLNSHSIKSVNKIIDFKTDIKNAVSSCKIAINVYPEMINHIIEEAEHFRDLLMQSQKGIELNMKKDIVEKEAFWDHIMKEHSEFIRGLLDPSEEKLFNMADKFAKEFDKLEKEVSNLKRISSDVLNADDLYSNTLKKTVELRNFKAQATEGLLDCKIKALISPLLSDHVLREANYYINILRSVNNM